MRGFGLLNSEEIFGVQRVFGVQGSSVMGFVPEL